MMSQVVYKYAIPVTDHPIIELPVGAVVLSVGMQGCNMYIWALIDPQVIAMDLRKFRVAGTGHLIEEEDVGKFLGTVTGASGVIVLHVFEV